MVEFSLTTLHGTIDTLALSVACPCCGYKFAFFHECPLYCAKCGKELPNILALARTDLDKLAYHKVGRTKGICRIV